MARYSLFVVKVPLNSNTTEPIDLMSWFFVWSWSWGCLGHHRKTVSATYIVWNICKV